MRGHSSSPTREQVPANAGTTQPPACEHAAQALCTRPRCSPPLETRPRIKATCRLMRAQLRHRPSPTQAKTRPPHARAAPLPRHQPRGIHRHVVQAPGRIRRRRLRAAPHHLRRAPALPRLRGREQGVLHRLQNAPRPTTPACSIFLSTRCCADRPSSRQRAVCRPDQELHADVPQRHDLPRQDHLPRCHHQRAGPVQPDGCIPGRGVQPGHLYQAHHF